MTTRTVLGIATIAFTLLASSHGSAESRHAKTLDMRVGGVSIRDGKVRALLLSGEQQGILPGDKGFFTKDGKKVPNSDFEVQLIGGRVAWTDTSFSTVDEMRFRTSYTARVMTPSRTCRSKGTKHARVTSARRESDSSVYFTVDAGTEDGLLPSSTLAMSGRGGMIDLTWVTTTSAGGYLRDVADPDAIAGSFHKLTYEVIACRSH